MRKILLFCGIYAYLAWNYANGYICGVRNSFFLLSVVYWSLSYVLCGGLTLKKEYKVPLVGVGALFFCVPLAAFYISEMAWNTILSTISFKAVCLNYLIWLAIQIGVFWISRNIHVSCYITLFSAFIFGVVNYYVLLFKGNPLTPSEILAAGTAIQVMGNYKFAIEDAIVNAILLLMMSLCVFQFIPKSNVKKERKELGYQVLIGAAGIAVIFAVLINVEWSTLSGLKPNQWDQRAGWSRNGGALSFVMDGQAMMIKKPEGYSVKAAEEILSTVEVKEEVQEVKPSVIAIMNESFVDVASLGGISSDPYLTNFNGISNYLVRGNTYASVYGGGTCNSEFEFLSGCSMANLSGSVYPYEMYNLDDIDSLPQIFSDNGYETIAIHPAQEENWNRRKVYEDIGFDDFISLEDMDKPKTIRGYYASDEESYKQVIQSYESAEGPVFIFNITMQNHGGYDGVGGIASLGEIEPIKVSDPWGQDSAFVTWLTLIRESDKAFQGLIEYFSQKEEPVIICMFGDHLPKLDWSLFNVNSGVLEELQKLYCTPYIVWSNFEIPEMNQNKNMSINYLGVNVLEYAGITTSYTQFLLDLQKEIPIVNAKGYQTKDGVWHNLEEKNALLEQYEMVQYYQLFDK